MNEKIRVTDEWLYKYMPIVDEAIIRELEKETDYNHQFSGRFEHRMKKLIKREKHPWLGVFSRLSKKAAVLFIGVLSFLFAVTMSVQAYRTRFFETVKSIWEDSIVYSYFVDQDQGDIQYKEPGFIPEGYHVTKRSVLGHWFSVIYTNEKGKIISWDQMLVQDGGEVTADIEYEQQIVEEVNGKNVVISLYSDGFVNAYCEDGEYVYVLTASGLSTEEVWMIFESIGDDDGDK